MQIIAAALSVSLLAVPAAHGADPEHGRHFKQKPPHAHSLAVDVPPGWESLARDGITLIYRRTPVDVTPSTGPGTATRSDFDGDGKDDTAAFSDNGVIVRYSSAAHRDHLYTDMPDGGCVCFGSPMVYGNFNGDAYDDLAIADQDEVDTTTPTYHAGAVWIFPGGPDGLQIDAVQHLNQSTAGVPGASENGDFFGGSLAAGDITGDGRDDLAVGVPAESLGSAEQAGGVVVLKGSPTGIVTTGALWIDQSTEGVTGTPETGDLFGWGLAIGKVDKNNYAELLVGTPVENDHDLNDGSGLVTQFWGGAGGVSLSNVTSVSGENITAAAKLDGMYAWEVGFSIGVTDTNGDGYGEVIIGDRGAEVGWNLRPGAVYSLAGRSTGLSATGVKVLSQDTADVAGATEDEDWFGQSIAVGDVTGDGLGDVLVGVPGEDIGTTVDAGSVVLLRGSSSGLTGAGSQSLDQSSSLVPGAAETDDTFGESVAMLNLDGTGPLEALAGTPGEEVTGDDRGYPSGTVTAFPVGSGGLGLGVTTTGRSLVPAGENIGRYGYYLAGPQSS
jgi:hypothetical protein